MSVVIPCFNEPGAVTPVLARLNSAREQLALEYPEMSLEIIVVDDGSTDATKSQLDKLPSEAVRVLRHQRNRGYGAALKTGIAHAQGDFIAFYDMDCTYDPMDLGDMLRAALQPEDRVELVCGARLSAIQGMPWTRWIGNMSYALGLRLLFWRRVTDACTGMRLLRRDTAVALAPGLPDDLNFTLAMTVTMLRSGRPFVEVPIRYGTREGQSKLNIVRHGTQFWVTILRFFVRGRRVARLEPIDALSIPAR